jgi:serine/threonine protein kinase/tetratricopeptide (TPR) repeat protein
MPQKLIGRYEISKRLARGGSAIVYLARDPLVKRDVAIKLLSRKFSADPKFRERFQREAEVIASLEHPNIVPIYDFGDHDGHMYIVMRYMSGGTLAERLKKGPYPLDDVNQVINRVSAALDEAHVKGIIHRDLKPANILFDQREDSFLSDFGIVKLMETFEEIDGKLLLGTPAYVSPEQARGEMEVTLKSDIYSLGVILFQLLTGQVPYEADSPIDLARKHITESIPDILSISPELPPGCQGVIARAMAKEPEARFTSAGDLAVMLEAATIAPSHAPMLPLSLIRQPAQLGTTEIESEISDQLEKAPRLASQPSPTYKLPYEPTPFIGRKDELAEIAGRLADPCCRLLTLTGPGGIGKTRLALHAAAESVGMFPHGTYFIPLTHLSSEEFILQTIAEVIQFSFYSPENQKTQLLNYLRGKNMLLVVDNFEHLIHAANLMAEIIRQAPHIKLIVTSRERLNLLGEWILDIHGLPYPQEDSTEDIQEYTAVQLFVQTAQRVKPGFMMNDEDKPAVIQICRLVEGIPLGIELAASWVRLLTCREIADEISKNCEILETSLRDIPERHRSLGIVFEYSWNLLSKHEKIALRKLAVFRGGFHRNAAQTVAGASLPLLVALADKSLVRRAPANRYEIPETIRQYAEEKLREHPDELQDTYRKFCHHFAGFLYARQNILKSGQQQDAFEQIHEEIGNLHAFWNQAIREADKETIEKSIESLYRFFEISGRIKEGVDAFAMAVNNLSAGMVGEETYGILLARLGGLNYRLGLYGEAADYLVNSLKIARHYRNTSEIAFSLNYLGAVNNRIGGFSKAQEHLQEGLNLYKELDDSMGAAISLHFLALVSRNLGNFQQAKVLHQESLTKSREIQDHYGIAVSLNNMGTLALGAGEYEEAHLLHQDSLAIRREIGDQWGTAQSLNSLGRLAYTTGKMGDAKQYFERSLQHYKEIGDSQEIATSMSNLGDIAWTREDYPTAIQNYNDALSIFNETGDPWRIAACLTNLGNVSGSMGDFRGSKRYFRAAYETAMKIRAIPIALAALNGVATMLANSAHKAEAIELFTLILTHPSSHAESKSKATRKFWDLKAELPSEVIAQAQQKGIKFTLEEVVLSEYLDLE